MDQDSNAQQHQEDQSLAASLEARETLEELRARHKKEQRELLAKVTALKKTATKGDKKKKKEVDEEIAQLKHAQSLQHEREEKEWSSLQGNSATSSSSSRVDVTSTQPQEIDDEDDFDVNDASALSRIHPGYYLALCSKENRYEKHVLMAMAMYIII